MSREAITRAYYRAVDAGEYDDLEALLAPGFVHDRPDRTLSSREGFVRFMREERPRTDTEHRVDAVYVPAGAGDGGDPDGDATADAVAVRGRLLDDGGEELFGFVDVFEFASADGRADAAVAQLKTYTD